MKVARVVQIPLTYPLHYERLLAFTTFPSWNTFHLTQFTLHLAVHHKHHPDQCAETYLLAQQTTAFQTALQHSQSSLDDEEEEDFQMVPSDDEHWTSEETPERALCIHEHGLPH